MSGWLLAAAGWAFHFYNSKANEERKARIERVNEQLRDFYGPLLASVFATKSAYDALVCQSMHGRLDYAGFQEACARDPHGPHATAYRMWMNKVLQPLNERAAAIVADHIDLLDAQQVVDELLQLTAHVSTMRVCLARWKEGDLSASSLISYPERLQEYVIKEFARLKLRQAQLLGFKPPPPPPPPAIARSKL